LTLPIFQTGEAGISVESNKAIVLQFFDAAGRGDRARMSALFAEYATWAAPKAFCEHIAATVKLKIPESGVVVGRDAIFSDLLGRFRTLFDGKPAKFRIDDVIAEGDKVVVLEHSDATGDNGNPYSNDYVFIFEIRDNQVVAVREYFDSWYAYETLIGE
jgi:ketosteroid isomerase-like protein